LLTLPYLQFDGMRTAHFAAATPQCPTLCLAFSCERGACGSAFVLDPALELPADMYRQDKHGLLRVAIRISIGLHADSKTRARCRISGDTPETCRLAIQLD